MNKAFILAAESSGHGVITNQPPPPHAGKAMAHRHEHPNYAIGSFCECTRALGLGFFSLLYFFSSFLITPGTGSCSHFQSLLRKQPVNFSLLGPPCASCLAPRPPRAFPAVPGSAGGGGCGRLLPARPAGDGKSCSQLFSPRRELLLLPSPSTAPPPARIGGRAQRGPAPSAVCEWGRRRGRGPRGAAPFLCAGVAAGRGRSGAKRAEAGGARLSRTHNPQRCPSGAEPSQAAGRIGP